MIIIFYSLFIIFCIRIYIVNSLFIILIYC
nr:MAG TPA: hypothetical protein [Caudoviricetes sp.]